VNKAVDRLTLPGPRAGWWLLGLLAVALPLGRLIVVSGQAHPDSESRAIRYKVREMNMLWRVNAEAEKLVETRLRELADEPAAASPSPSGAAPSARPATATGDRSPGDRSPGDRSPARAARQEAAREQARHSLDQLAARRDAEQTALRELFADATALPRDDTNAAATTNGRQAAIRAVVAHCLATGRHALAVEFVSGLRAPGRDIKIAIAAASPIGTARRLSGMTTAAAAAAASSRSFAPTWSRFERDRVRARLHALAGNGSRAARLHERLNGERDTLFAAFNALRIAVALAGLLGVFMIIATAVRAWVASAAGLPRLGWLLARFPGLGAERVYHADALVPLLGFGGWLLGYALAGAVFAILPGQRPIGGLAVLFQSAAGIAVTWAIISAFSRTDPPLAAARVFWRPDGMASPWQASTAALVAFCALWPFVAVAFLLSAVFFGGDAQPHTVAQLMLADPDPFMLAAMGVAVVVVAPIGEELFFRGFIHPILRQRFGPVIAIAITAALFSAVHMTPAFALVFFTLGVAFSLLYEWVGSLWASVVLHGLWNACVFTYVVCVAYS